jgi:hypothetical protein
MARSHRSSRAKSFVAVAAAFATFAPEAAANPPAPTNWPDPPPQTPKTGAAPISIQKHDSGCFVHYEGGGNAKVDCPASLQNEPPGESIEKSADGTCHYMMTISRSGGSSGPTPCPETLAGGAITTATASPTSTTTGGTPPPSIKPAERSGCGACSISSSSRTAQSTCVALGASSLALLVARRRRRRGAPTPRGERDVRLSVTGEDFTLS